MDKKWKIAALAVFIVVSGIIYVVSGMFGESEVTLALEAGDTPSASVEVETVVELDRPGPLYVHVAGAVLHPGVYVLAEGDRVLAAIEKAGGLAPEADGAAVNQARKLKDGEKLYIPRLGEAQDALAAGPVLVDINTASKEQLMTLPGIGETRADDIIAYRNRTGGFDTIEAIMEVEGIKEAMFEKLEPLITTIGR